MAAWNTLCSLIDQSLDSTVPAVRESLWDDGIWARAFELYIQHAQSARPKSSRQLLATLTNCLKQSRERDLRHVKNDAARQLVSALLNYEDASSAKVSAQLLSHMLSKDVLSTDDLLGTFCRSYNSHQSGSGVDELLLVLFKWLNRGDFGSTIAHLVSVFLDKLPPSAGHAVEQPIWVSPLQTAFIHGAVNTDDLRAHVLPGLFKRSFGDFVAFLHSQGLDSLLSTSEATTSLDHQELLYIALQTGKELGLIEETDEPSISRAENYLCIPLDAIRDMLFHSSRPIRVTGLYLLVTSHATTRPLSRKALRLLQKTLGTVFADVDADFRGDVFTAFQQLIDRCRSISATLARELNTSNGQNRAQATNYKGPPSAEQLSAHSRFLHWLREFLCWQLRPTASYQRHISALKCLAILAKSGLSDSIPRAYYSKSALSGPKWPFTMQIITADMERLLFDLVLDPFDDVRQTAYSILAIACNYMMDNSRDNVAPVIKRAENTTLATGRADHADGVAHLWGLQTLLNDLRSEASQQAIVERLLGQLEQSLSVARRGLAAAVVQYPVHGLLTSIRHVLRHTKATEDNLNSRIYDDLCQVWDVVKPVLCNDAPEGYTVDQAEEGLDSTKETLSYCWRALKEASLLMSSLVTTQPVHDEDLQNQISDLCFKQLAELRHRGAFSTVAQTWMTCCMLCKSAKSSMGVPMLVVWYTKVLGMLRSNVTINTRRSAGIPSLLCGILIADKSGKLLASAMADLEGIARHPVHAASAEEGSLPQVHAMNCLKDVLKSTRLGEQSERYVSTALQLAADALRSDVWAVRNCGLMLFRAVIDRLLGTDQSHFDHEGAAQTLISIHQHPQLIDVILDLLANSNSGQSGLSTGFEGVFPALQLLQHIQVPLVRLDVVKQAVESLTANASWHIRDKAARSLATLAASDEPAMALQSIRNLVLSSKNDRNALHGALLTSLHFISRLKLAANRSHETSAQTASLLSDNTSAQGFVAEMWSLSRVSDCSVIQAAALDVMRASVELSSAIGSDAVEFDTAELTETCCPANFDEPSQATLRQAAARLMARTLSRSVASYSEDDAAAYIQWVRKLTRQDENACEHFLRSLSLPKAAPDGLGDGTIYSICAEILRSEVGVHLMCEAQRILLTLHPDEWRTRRGMIGNAAGPRHYLSQDDCNQRFADQWLQIRAIELDIRAADGSADGSDVLADIALWVDDCVAAVDGQGLHTREAAASAIARMNSMWPLLVTDTDLHDNFIRLCIAVYDLLNDDDEDTRLLAAAVTRIILAAGRTDKALNMEPITASRKLLAFCEKRWPSSTALTEAAFKRAFDMCSASPASVSDQLQELSHGDTALFVEEKQNLYVDEASEVRAWSRVLQRLSTVAISRRSLKHLGTWVLAGVQTLVQHADMHPDGALGWSSKPDIFKLVLQVIYGAEVILGMAQRGIKLPVRPSEIRRQLFHCLTAFEKADVVCLLQWELQRILSDSVIRKISLIRERMLALA